MAGWQSGYAADCKSVYTSSILVSASILCPGGGIGRHKGFKIPRRKACRFKSGSGYHSSTIWEVKSKALMKRL